MRADNGHRYVILHSLKTMSLNLKVNCHFKVINALGNVMNPNSDISFCPLSYDTVFILLFMYYCILLITL